MDNDIHKLIIHGDMPVWREAIDAVEIYLSKGPPRAQKNDRKSLMFRGVTGIFFVSQRSTGTVTIHVSPKE